MKETRHSTILVRFHCKKIETYMQKIFHLINLKFDLFILKMNRQFSRDENPLSKYEWRKNGSFELCWIKANRKENLKGNFCQKMLDHNNNSKIFKWVKVQKKIAICNKTFASRWDQHFKKKDYYEIKQNKNEKNLI